MDPCRTASLITVVIVTIWTVPVVHVAGHPSFTHCNGNKECGSILRDEASVYFNVTAVHV